MTLKMIAEICGVSVGTVSKAFSGSLEISEDTRQKIFDVAKQNGCFDKYNKNKFEKKVIAVICPEVQSDYYDTILSILNKEISSQNGIMCVSLSNFSAKREQELFNYYSSYCHADGIIIIGMHDHIINNINIPTVAIGANTNKKNIDVIKSDIYSSIEKAVFYLKENGHTQIAFLGESLTFGKLSMFEQAIKKAELEINPDFIKTGTSRFEEAGIQAMNELFKNDTLPTAIMAAYDYIAIGAMKCIHSHGMEVPKDFSVIGMDDISIIPYLDTPISSIKTYTDEACRAAVDLIIKKIDNQFYTAKQHITISSDFVVRESIRKII